jgi:hypothetical protein
VSTSLLWFRRDLRLADHPALLAARATPIVDHADERWAALERDMKVRPGA